MKRVKSMRRRGRSYYYRLTQYVTVRDEVSGKVSRKRVEHWEPLGADYAVACRRLAVLKRDAVRTKDGGSAAPVLEVTVRELARRWLQSYVRTARNERGRHLAAVRVGLYVDPFLGGELARRVTPDGLRAYRVWLEGGTVEGVVRVGRVLSVQTVRHVLSDARCLFRWAVDSEYLVRSPVPRKWLPRVQELAPERLTDEEVGRVLAIEEPWRFVVRFGLETGLRWGEMVRARTSDVLQGMLVVTQTKSGRMRSVPVSADLLRGRVGRVVPFVDPTGFARVVRRQSGVARFHVHMLRHTFASRWVERGGSLVALQKALGHASYEMTLRYARMSDAAVRAEWERIEGVGGRLGGSGAVSRCGPVAQQDRAAVS